MVRSDGRMSRKEVATYVDRFFDALADPDALFYLDGGHFSRPIPFDAFTLDEVRSLAEHYSGFTEPEGEAAQDAHFLVEHKQDIYWLAYRPGNYLESDQLLFWVERLIERSYFAAVRAHDQDTQAALLDVLNFTPLLFDSLLLQDALLFAIERGEREGLASGAKERRILEFFWVVNVMILEEGVDEDRFCHRVECQKRCIRALFAYAEHDAYSDEGELGTSVGDATPDLPVGDGVSDTYSEKDTPEVHDGNGESDKAMSYDAYAEKLYSMVPPGISRLLCLNQYHAAVIPEFLLTDIADENQAHLYHLSNGSGVSFALRDFDEMGLSRMIGYLFITLGHLMHYLVEKPSLGERIDVRYRLIGFHREALDECSPFDIVYPLYRLAAGLGDGFPKAFRTEVASALSDIVEDAVGLLARVRSGEVSMAEEERMPEMSRYRRAFDAEVLYTACVLEYDKNTPDADSSNSWDLLHRMRYVFAIEDAVILVMADEGGTHASAFRVDAATTVQLVENMMRFIDEIANGEALTFSSYSQGPLALLVRQFPKIDLEEARKRLQ